MLHQLMRVGRRRGRRLWGVLLWTVLSASLAQAEELGTVEVSSISVEGNTLLPAAVIEQRLEAFKGRRSLAQMREAASAVQELYRRAGYGAVVAFLPEQTVAGGALRIRVVEGKLERVDVVENKYFSTENVLASLPSLTVGVTPHVREIDAQIQMANESPAKAVQVLLQPGSKPGAVAAKVTVNEQPAQRWTVRADNTGSERTGRWRAGLGWMHANMLDRDHVLSAELQTAPQRPSGVAVVSVGYRAPIYGRALALDAFGAWSDVDAGKTATAAGDLNFVGRGRIAGVRANAYLPRQGNWDQRLVLGLEHRDYLNDCSIEGLPDGACGSAGASVSVQPLSLTYTGQSTGEYRLGFSAGLQHNLAAGGGHGSAANFEAVRPGAKRRYMVMRVSANVAAPVLETGLLLNVRAVLQRADSALIPGEQFGLGGTQSIRGFEEREVNGDSGHTVSVELVSFNLAEPWLQLKQGDLRTLLFAEAGWVSNRDSVPCQIDRTRCRMGSLGAGLRFFDVARWQLRLDLARAFTTAVQTQRGDWRLHVGASASF